MITDPGSRRVSQFESAKLVDDYRAYIKRTGMTHRRFANFAKINANWHNDADRTGHVSQYRCDRVKATMRHYPDGVQEDNLPVKSLTQDEINRRREAREAKRREEVQYWLDRENAPDNYFGTRTPVERMVA